MFLSDFLICKLGKQRYNVIELREEDYQYDFCTCSKCGAKLGVEENDTTPGCREMEEVTCPVCHEKVTKVFTSGIPSAYAVDE